MQITEEPELQQYSSATELGDVIYINNANTGHPN